MDRHHTSNGLCVLPVFVDEGYFMITLRAYYHFMTVDLSLQLHLRTVLLTL